MVWKPGIPLRRDEPVYRVSATDAETVASAQSCPLALALKVRPKTSPDTGEWTRRRGPFVLGVLADAIQDVGLRVKHGYELWDAVRLQARRFGSQHEGVRQFFDHALTQFFEYHEAREEEVGPLRFLDGWPDLQKGPRASLFAWALLYETDTGCREIRRIRVATASNKLTPWAYVAGHIAAQYQTSIEPQRIWVTEIGLNDGIEFHLISGESPDRVEELYQSDGRDAVLATTKGEERIPGRVCGGCEYLGGCESLIPLNGFLQTDNPGPWTRSVSASDLVLYETCPSRWYMEREVHLPRVEEGSEPLLRGLATHQWLAQAHGRSKACTADELPNPADIDRLGIVGEAAVDPGDYELAYPFLRSHIDCCPLNDDSIRSLTAERTLYAFDAQADAVIATKADAFWLRGDTLIMREIKTVQVQPEADRDQIFSAYLAVAWDLVALETGFISHFGAVRGEVQLEILSPDAAVVHTYSTDDEALMRMARGRIRRLGRDWLADVQWAPTPNPGCTRCSVRRWCGIRDAWADAVATKVDAGAEDISLTS
ncbi:PD-(D/E)XK nuclease superfamily protein [Micromonospora palomenae]|uniref:PD-(D/E)XK nuclease superfamily protein n=1 Tax=Micromonospora palomenae TaxID=1461247 RepID=A0A561WWM0_9ACTN|nr:PD-(D/E)XK nuclease family protein [Micromonospora palomenae]TWG28262.1 PD-(D/E)XK nuclease superfamily protein [Micromonospora palomenae]